MILGRSKSPAVQVGDQTPPALIKQIWTRDTAFLFCVVFFFQVELHKFVKWFSSTKQRQMGLVPCITPEAWKSYIKYPSLYVNFTLPKPTGRRTAEHFTALSHKRITIFDKFRNKMCSQEFLRCIFRLSPVKCQSLQFQRGQGREK